MSINPVKSNILEELASYNSETLDDNFSILSNVLLEQIKLNEFLKKQNHDDNILFIKNFISRNKNQIDYQLEEILNITEQIQEICLENETLKNQKNEYKELIESEECVEIANKLNKIKKSKEKIRAFLLKKGIHTPLN